MARSSADAGPGPKLVWPTGLCWPPARWASRCFFPAGHKAGNAGLILVQGRQSGKREPMPSTGYEVSLESEQAETSSSGGTVGTGSRFSQPYPVPCPSGPMGSHWPCSMTGRVIEVRVDGRKRSRRTFDDVEHPLAAGRLGPAPPGSGPHGTATCGSRPTAWPGRCPLELDAERCLRRRSVSGMWSALRRRLDGDGAIMGSGNGTGHSWARRASG